MPETPSGIRETEPLPRSVKPALLFLGFLFAVVMGIAGVSYFVDRLYYG